MPLKKTRTRPPEKKIESRKVPLTVAAVNEVLTREDMQLVDEACREISSILQDTVARGTLEVGQYVLRTFFDDDPEFVRSRSKHKYATFSLLTQRCETDALPVKKSWLHNAVGLACKSRELEGQSDSYDRISVTHRIRLLPVKNPQDVERLAQEVLDKNLSTRELQERVAVVLARQPRRPGGRKAKNPLVRSLERAERTLAGDNGKTTFIRNEQLVGMAEEEARLALAAAIALATRVEGMVKLLEARLASK